VYLSDLDPQFVVYLDPELSTMLPAAVGNLCSAIRTFYLHVMICLIYMISWKMATPRGELFARLLKKAARTFSMPLQYFAHPQTDDLAKSSEALALIAKVVRMYHGMSLSWFFRMCQTKGLSDPSANPWDLWPSHERSGSDEFTTCSLGEKRVAAITRYWSKLYPCKTPPDVNYKIELGDAGITVTDRAGREWKSSLPKIHGEGVWSWMPRCRGRQCTRSEGFPPTMSMLQFQGRNLP